MSLLARLQLQPSSPEFSLLACLQKRMTLRDTARANAFRTQLRARPHSTALTRRLAQTWKKI